MLFNSWQFVIFFIVIYSLYRALNHRGQNILLLIGSYFFYGCWNWHFLFLLWISTLVDYYCGLKIGDCQEPHRKKIFLAISVILNLGFLGFFKYCNFFIDSFKSLLHIFGVTVDLPFLHIILPVGISFYTFQEISYVIDIYRGDLKPVRNLLHYALFVVYFPHLVAGPIQMPSNLLPQVSNPRTMTVQKNREGIFLIGWGLFKKIFVADNLAPIVNMVFAQKTGLSAWQVLLGSYAFAFQIYADFSGYTDIARGVSKLMGFELMLNFNLPYFATSPRDFWRRWHISLSTWIKHYLYVPLGGNRKGEWRTYLNLLITMSLAGLWHGASWTFAIWGFYHGALLALHRLLEPLWRKFFSFKNEAGIRVLWFLKVILTFHLVCLGWLFFRAESLAQATDMIRSLFVSWTLDWKTFYYFKELVLFSWFLLWFQILQLRKKDLAWIVSAPAGARITFAAVMAAIIFVSYSIGMPSSKEFIYFQF